MKIEFEISKDNFLIGLSYYDFVAEDLKSGEQFETNGFSIGFLFFSINFIFEPRR